MTDSSGTRAPTGSIEALTELLRQAHEQQASLERRVEELQRARDLSEERLASVLEGTKAGSWEWNVKTGETVFNERWAEIVGWTLAELAPISIQTWLDLAHPEDLEESGRRLARVFAREDAHYDFECRMRHRDGSWVWVHDRGIVIEWAADGSPVRMAGSWWTASAWRRARKRPRKRGPNGSCAKATRPSSSPWSRAKKRWPRR